MGHSIADRRKALGLTQTELALASRLSRPQISAVETGRHTPNVKAALAIAQAPPLAKHGHKVPMTSAAVERALLRLVQ